MTTEGSKHPTHSRSRRTANLIDGAGPARTLGSGESAVDGWWSPHWLGSIAVGLGLCLLAVAKAQNIGCPHCGTHHLDEQTQGQWLLLFTLKDGLLGVGLLASLVGAFGPRRFLSLGALVVGAAALSLRHL
ncbi:MAG: hypothetical protein Q8L14_07335 [Myxococcales bacterium]|nr:hypothetical protein [Myxococcales bacterium]